MARAFFFFFRDARQQWVAPMYVPLHSSSRVRVPKLQLEVVVFFGLETAKEERTAVGALGNRLGRYSAVRFFTQYEAGQAVQEGASTERECKVPSRTRLPRLGSTSS